MPSGAPQIATELPRISLGEVRWARDGAGRLGVHPGARSACEEAGLRTVDDFLTAPGELISRHQRTEVIRLTLPGGLEIYLKRHLRPHRKDAYWAFTRHCRPISAAWEEWKNMDRLAAVEVATPVAVALGERGRGLNREPSFLATQAVQGCEPLPALLTRLDAVARRRVAGLLARTLRRMHEARLDHPDLYARHVLVHHSLESCVLLDVQRTRRRRRLHWRWRHRDLAALDVTLDPGPVPDTLRLRFLAEYCPRPDRARWLAAAVRRRTPVLRQRGRGL